VRIQVLVSKNGKVIATGARVEGENFPDFQFMPAAGQAVHTLEVPDEYRKLYASELHARLRSALPMGKSRPTRKKISKRKSSKHRNAWSLVILIAGWPEMLAPNCLSQRQTIICKRGQYRGGWIALVHRAMIRRSLSGLRLNGKTGGMLRKNIFFDGIFDNLTVGF
jgi:hypothetical protein